MKYEIDKKILKKVYIKKYQKINLFYIFFVTIIFVMVTNDVIKYNILVYLLYYFLLLITLSLILYFVNKLYITFLVKNNFCIEVNDNKIIINNTVIDLKNIKEIICSKDRIIIKSNNDKFIVDKCFFENETDFYEFKNDINKNSLQSKIKNI